MLVKQLFWGLFYDDFESGNLGTIKAHLQEVQLISFCNKVCFFRLFGVSLQKIGKEDYDKPQT